VSRRNISCGGNAFVSIRKTSIEEPSSGRRRNAMSGMMDPGNSDKVEVLGFKALALCPIVDSCQVPNPEGAMSCVHADGSMSDAMQWKISDGTDVLIGILQQGYGFQSCIAPSEGNSLKTRCM